MDTSGRPSTTGARRESSGARWGRYPTLARSVLIAKPPPGPGGSRRAYPSGPRRRAPEAPRRIPRKPGALASLIRLRARTAYHPAGAGRPAAELGHLDTHVVTPAPRAASPAAPPAPMVDDDDRYQPGEVIGRGGMGEVRTAVDRRIGRDVAIKVLSRSAGDSPDAVARFLREAKVQGILDHPSIVPVHDLGLDADGRPYFVMKRLSGTTLADVVRAQAAGGDPRFSRRTLLARFADVCLAIEFAHRRGVVHRDIKPSNVMLGDYGEVWILDWGCAKVAGEASRPPTPVDSAALAPAGETCDGAVIGTPGYMAPEQLIAGAPCYHRVDVYALGCVLFEILAGETLHPTGQAAVRSTVLGADARASVRAPDADVPPELDDVCVRATALGADQRYPTVRALHDAVLHYLDGDRDLARRRELAAHHVAAARAARAAQSPARAMREAGRALALDPGSAEAAAMVAEVMLEPPTAPPREVTRALEHADAEIGRVHGRATMWAFVTYLGILGLFLHQGITDWALFAAVAGLVVVLGGSAVIGSRMRELPSLGLVVLVALGNGLLITLLSRFAGPFVVLPAALCAAVMALISHPVTLSRPGLVLTIMCGGFCAPFGLEALGVWEPTWLVSGGALVSRSGFVDFSAPGVAALLVVLTLLVTVWTGYTTRALVVLRRDAQRRVELQAWHLRQLVENGDHSR
jgi:hypothetical protein